MAPQGRPIALDKKCIDAHHQHALVVSLAFAVCALTWGVQSAAQRLPDAVRASLRANPDVLGAAANARAAADSYDQAAAGRLPTVDVRVGEGRETSDNTGLQAAGIGSRTLTRQEASLTLRQNIFDGSQVSSDMERQSFRLDSARARLFETAEIIALRVAEAYLDTLRDQGLVQLAEDTLARHREILSKTMLRFKSGVGQKADVAQAEARVALATSTLIATRGSLEDSIARYVRVVGSAPGALTEPEPAAKHLPPAPNVAKSQAEEGAYGVAAARADLNAARANVRSVRADLVPRVDVELSANRNRNIDGITGPNNDNQAMLVMRYNLFRGGADQARVREAVERETVALEAVNSALQSTGESVARAWAALVAARDRIAPLEAHVRAGEQVRQAYREQFELGRRSLLDLVNAEAELYQARSALLSGRMALRVIEYRLLAAVGAMVKSLGLESELAQMDTGRKDR